MGLGFALRALASAASRMQIMPVVDHGSAFYDLAGFGARIARVAGASVR